MAHPHAGKVFDLPGLHEELASCYANTGRYDEAIGAMNRALAAGFPRANSRLSSPAGQD